ncbi:MAG: DUF1559 domain-containing protein, partial [Thermoguttaceae bacterium]|nr:DUF1559 domain-containing protein [Thermoguttaceae bacterium]
MSRLNFKRRRAAGRGFTLVELLTLVAVACLLLNLLLPAVLSSRDKSRRSKCANNLKQLALAAQNYHDVNGALPAGQDACNLGYGFRVSLLPYLEQFGLYQGVMYEGFEKGVRFADLDAEVKTAQIDVNACPADPGASRIVGGFRPASYVACYGDFCPNVAPYDAASPRSWVRSRGAIAPKTWTNLAVITDGTANTALFSETVVAVPGASTIKNGVATGTSSVFGAGFVLNSCMRPGFKPQVCLTYADGANYRPDVAVYQARGSRWGDGRDVFSAFSTILPPNSPNCSLGGVGDAGGNPQLLSATSHHRGGVNVALVDGSVRFVSETIDCGNLTGSTIGVNAGLCSYGKSPFGVWGALGSCNGGETGGRSALDDAPSLRSLF